jgi:hypothetical protein
MIQKIISGGQTGADRTGLVIIISVALTFDRSKTATIKYAEFSGG